MVWHRRQRIRYSHALPLLGGALFWHRQRVFGGGALLRQLVYKSLHRHRLSEKTVLVARFIKKVVTIVSVVVGWRVDRAQPSLRRALLHDRRGSGCIPG